MKGNGKDEGGASDQIAEHPESEGRLGRRALLAGAAAAGVGVAAAVVSRPEAASAADGSPLLLGDAVTNAASTLTTVTTTGAGGLVWDSSATGTTALTGADTASPGGYGVQGTSTKGIGVYGQTSSADVVHNGAVVGYNGSGGNALVGKVNGSTAGAQAVLGSDTTTVTGSYGVVGESTNGYGVVAQGGLAPLILLPASTTGAPTTGAHSLGGLYVDSAGTLWLCVASGNPGTWRMIQGPTTAGAFHAITPARVYDSRREGTKAKTTSGTTYTVTVANEINDSTGAVAVANVVPAGATAIVANLTIAETVAAGYLTVSPTGGHSTSSINWTASNQTIANGLTVGISSSRTVSVYAVGSTHFILDVTGYYL